MLGLDSPMLKFNPRVLLDNDKVYRYEPLVKSDIHGVYGELFYKNGERAVFNNHKIFDHSYDSHGLFVISQKGELVTYVRVGKTCHLIRDESVWKNSFSSVSVPVVGVKGKIAVYCKMKKGDKRHKVVVDDVPWKNDFVMCRSPVIGPNGEVAVIVGVSNYFTIAVDDVVWKSKYDSIDQLQIGKSGDVSARVVQNQELRLSLNDKTSLNVFEEFDNGGFDDGKFTIGKQGDRRINISQFKIADENEGHFKLDEIDFVIN